MCFCIISQFAFSFKKKRPSFPCQSLESAERSIFLKKPLFTGSAAALVTPLRAGAPDLAAFRALIERQLAGGTDALVVCGTTGEAATLTPEERRAVISACIAQVGGRVPVVVGTGANDTARACALSREAETLGADGLLVVTPYYNKATQDGLVRHFTAVADAVRLPVILYNVPSRTGVSCAAETYAALSEHPQIVGVKEASGNFALLQDTRRLCPPDFFVWSGNDEDTAAVMALGGVGVISTAANLIPREMHELTALCLADRFREAGQRQIAMSELLRALFCEVNPIPIKTALARLGLCGGELRLPLSPMQPENERRLLRAMERFGLAA